MRKSILGIRCIKASLKLDQEKFSTLTPFSDVSDDVSMDISFKRIDVVIKSRSLGLAVRSSVIIMRLR